MCGITGYFHKGAQKEELRLIIRQMTDLLPHRGPDGHGYFVDSKIALGHRRLSIIDLSLGAQPMSNKEERVWVVFNGEIYNFLEIRTEFQKKGYSFKTHSDTEVLIALYEEYGTEMLSYLNGMFAFAIWDSKKEQLFVARDRLGKKPLFYYWDDNRFIFSSEMKSMLVSEVIPRVVSTRAIDMYFTFGFIPAPYTIFENIHKLMPGHYLIFSEHERKTKKYWDIKFGGIDKEEDPEHYKKEFYELFYGAVKRRLISDVPLGAFLSGGIDSSGVVGMMSIVNQIPVKTFTIGFDEAEFSESEDAQLVANYFKTMHKEMIVRPSSFEILWDLIWHFDEPFGDSSAIPTFYVSKMARRFVTVVLSGDGGDEMFAGYNRYQRIDQFKYLKRLPKWMKQHFISPLADVIPLNAPGKNLLMDIANHQPSSFGLGIYPFIKDVIFSGELQSALNDQPLTYNTFPQIGNMDDLPEISKRQYLDIKLYLPDDILTKVDKMSMANSLETRAPLLDFTIAEFAAKLPPEWHMVNGKGKAFLKSVFQRFLPRQVFSKPKHGFSIPKKDWFKKELNNYASEILLSQRLHQRGYFKKDIVEKVLKAHFNDRRDFGKWIWCLINFELWHQCFLDKDTRRI